MASVKMVTGLVALLAFLVSIALGMGALLPGDDINAFTTDPLQTHVLYITDFERHLFRRLEVTGHEDEVPVWSPEARQIVYFPR